MTTFSSIAEIATKLRKDLDGAPPKAGKKYLLLFAYNGTGKTRLSMAFKDLGKTEETSDTLYFNAFTEDLFSWDNDLEGDSQRFLKLNSKSLFIQGIKGLKIDDKIRERLQNYTDYDFKIDTDAWVVRFSRTIRKEVSPNTFEDETYDNIKVSRGEENLFIWCFFLAVVELAMDKDIEAYSWVKYVYIDDPISSLDENNAIALGHHLAMLLKKPENTLKTVISSHHTLFFNVMCNEFRKEKGNKAYFLGKNKANETYILKGTSDTPFFYHVAMLTLLKEAAVSGDLYTYHFSILRSLLEKTSSFLGYNDFSVCIGEDDPDKLSRIIQILNHGNYSMFEPKEMLAENKQIFTKILNHFIETYQFNPDVFPPTPEEA